MKKILKTAIMGLAVLGALAVSMPAAHATVVTFTAANGATATADFTFGAGSLLLKLTDTSVNPADVAFDLSGFRFTVAGSTGALLASSSGMERTVAGDGTFTNGPTVDTGWVFSAASTTYTLDDLSGAGHAGPAHTLIGTPDGSNVYSNMNNSVAGNGPHNPVLANTITFNFTFTGGSVTANSQATNIAWQFGTTPGFTGGTVPEPISMSLVGGGLLALGLFRKRFVA